MHIPQVIVIDGPDGAGKTTQVQLLADYLTAHGHRVHITRASGGTPIGEELRKASLSAHDRRPETDLYISLAMHTELGHDLQERRQAGETIIVDRSPLALIAYNTYGSQLPDQQMGIESCKQLLQLWQVDHLVFMDAPQGLLDDRRHNRGHHDYFETQGAAFHHRVRQGYEASLALLQHDTHLVKKVTVINAAQSVDDVHNAIVQAVAK